METPPPPPPHKKKKKKKKKKNFLSNLEYFVWNWEKTYFLALIGNGAEFRPQNQVIESPDM